MKNTLKSNSAPIRLHSGKHLAIFVALTVFGILYDRWIAEQERQFKEGRTSLWVTFGCMVTLTGAAILTRQNAMVTFLCFVASGIPMILGSLARHFGLIERAERRNSK